jgi:hypothetical protein
MPPQFPQATRRGPIDTLQQERRRWLGSSSAHPAMVNHVLSMSNTRAELGLWERRARREYICAAWGNRGGERLHPNSARRSAESARFLRASVHVRVRSAEKIRLTTRAHTSALPSGPWPTATQNAPRSEDRLAARVWGLARRAGKERSWAAQREMGSGPNRAFAAQLGYFPIFFCFYFLFPFIYNSFESKF